MRQHVMPQRKSLTLQPLTPSAFAPYGTVVENPVRSGSELVSTAVSANQDSATKYANITPVVNKYERAPTCKAAVAKMAMFVCKPRTLIAAKEQRGESALAIPVLERHPYTTQTFLPLGLSPEDSRTTFIVVVAPTLRDGPGTFDGPDVARAEAFLANGGQGVTYGVGTWHAPMIVVGQREVEFAVVQYVNGVSRDECEEVELVGMEGKGPLEVNAPLALRRTMSRL